MLNPIMLKTDYSLLKSSIKINELNFFNAKIIGIVDDNLNYVMEFYNYCQKTDIKPLFGLDYLYKSNHIYLYALNENGYNNLLKINNNLKEKTDDILCLITCENIFLYSELNKEYETVYIAYKNKQEKEKALKVTKNVVFGNVVMCFNNNDTFLLKCLNGIENNIIIKDIETDYLDCYPLLANEADENSVIEFAKLFNLKLNFNKLYLPKVENSLAKLKQLIKLGLNKRLNNKVTSIYLERIKYELGVIEEMQFVDYFMVVYDYVLYAKKNNILVGPGRGSAAGSLICYALGITEIDPIKYDLLFERFLNKERISLPDIDLDFEYDKRDLVIKYIKDKYGNDYASLIVTYGTLKARQVIRDVGKVMDIDNLLINNLLKYINPLKNLNDNLTFDLKNYLKRNELEQFYQICFKLENIKRHYSTHAAGIIISSESIKTLIPVVLNGENNLTGYTYNYLEQIGLIKMDILGLKNLTIISNVLEIIKEKDNKLINLNQIPLNDSKTLKMFYDVETKGIFQFESNGMMNFLQKLKVNSFNDLINAVALFRPGPMNNIDTFVKRKHGLEQIDYLHPDLKPILESTYGIIVYQEQVMQILNKIASYTYAEADLIRRAMSKKKKEIIIEEKEKFIIRSQKNGYSQELIEKIYDYILKFAGYGFNKAHSVSYALLGYQMAYLKSNYPLYYLQNLLNMSIGSEIKTKEYLELCRNYNIDILKPNINECDRQYKIINNSLMMPIITIKNIGDSINDIILMQRTVKGYLDYFDFIVKMYANKVNQSIIIILINAGALDCFKLNRATMLHNLVSAFNYAELIHDLDESLVTKPIIEEVEEKSTNELIQDEMNSYGLFISNHPVLKYQNKIKLINLHNYFDKIVDGVFLVNNIKLIKTKKNEDMAFIDIEDETKIVSLIVFSNKISFIRDININSLIKINGKVEKRLDKYQIVVNNITKV